MPNGGGDEKATGPNLACAGATTNLVDDATVQKALAKLVDALGAVKVTYGKSKDQFDRSPDWTVIVRAAELLLAYGPGRPIERQVRLTGDVSTFDDKITRLLATPAGVELARNLGLVEPIKDAKPKAKRAAQTEGDDNA